MGIVRYTVDTLPPLTDEERAKLRELAAKPDSEIDFSDIPELTEEQMAKFVRRNQLYKPVKQATTVRLDADVLLWLKSQGKGYQTRLNSILREAMLKDRH
jgi:uncharacterized protein (DUF4415 family)